MPMKASVLHTVQVPRVCLCAFAVVVWAYMPVRRRVFACVSVCPCASVYLRACVPMSPRLQQGNATQVGPRGDA